MSERIWSSKAYRLFGDGTLVDKADSVNVPGVDFPNVTPDWKPYWSENMGHEPVYISSRSHWRDELRARGLKCVDSGKEYVSKKEALRRRSKTHFRFSAS